MCVENGFMHSSMPAVSLGSRLRCSFLPLVKMRKACGCRCSCLPTVVVLLPNH